MSNFTLGRVTRTLLGSAVGFIACSVILQKLDPLMPRTDVWFYSTLAAGVLAAISWKLG
jgi:hypothetical protein